MSNAPEQHTVTPDTGLTTIRLRLGRRTSRATVLDGGWWPRSRDPVTELPGLIAALDAHGRVVSHVMLGVAGWVGRPRKLVMGGRTIRLGWFTTQSASLLIATYRNGVRTDLLVVPPETPEAWAKAVMTTAANPVNLLHADDILAAMRADRPPPDDASPVMAWRFRTGAPSSARSGEDPPCSSGSTPPPDHDHSGATESRERR